ncbi:MAG: carbohydrate ABC transporter permease [Candidatus Omnitrophica bacterium]|nr:carbohydrate ABC transporter permease [Candidatus Omnitrophota bacterium]MDE2009499.1 carbohydrate ABC transporter permease [Candidatus Omnitrophota bacterium]MDE2215101.1 carbohydrate ABC transporter permease [Candidatus Omnitrophota bacterium]MDE2232062.1 carbohydrate ABC transporter permease [Candidatus Omnitrophota bacterium]
MARSTLTHTFLMGVAITCLFPIFWMVRCALMTNQTVFVDEGLIPHHLDFGNFARAWTEGNFAVFFLNSVVYTTCVVTGIVIISSLAAFAFSRLDFPGKNVIFYMFVAAMMIPLPGSFVPLFVLMTKLHLVNTRLGYILCMINVGLSLSILILKTFFDKMPHELEDAARIDGCSKIGIWWHMALPFARPAIAVIVIFNALNVWNEYILAFLLLDNSNLMPLQRGLMVFQGANGTNYPVLMAGLTMAAIPIIMVYLFMQKYIVKGLSGEVVG